MLCLSLLRLLSVTRMKRAEYDCAVKVSSQTWSASYASKPGRQLLVLVATGLLKMQAANDLASEDAVGLWTIAFA